MKSSVLLEAVLDSLKTTYAIVDGDGLISEHHRLFPEWVSEHPEKSFIGTSLFDVLPEFIGQEEVLEELYHQQKPILKLENINRHLPSGQTRYLTLVIIPGQTTKKLIVLVTDVTEQGKYTQELMQSRNEIQLVRNRLAKLSYQLDYLLRHYLPPDVADSFLKEGQTSPQFQLGGELREVSILFADVRNFTPLSERLAPDLVVQLLNDYLQIAAEAIEAVDGAISQFQGDNLMVIFNISGTQPDHAERAVQAALILQYAVDDYHQNRSDEEPLLDFGIGINTGMALIGNIGAQRRYSYTAIGDAVNLAARITGAVPAGEIWLSETTVSHLKEMFVVEPLTPLKFKGKSKPSKIFELLFKADHLLRLLSLKDQPSE